MTNTLKTTLLGAAAAFAFALPAAAGDDSMGKGDFMTSDNAMVDGMTLTLESVTSPQDGYLVVHAMEEGTYADPIGHAPLEEGENMNVEVELSQEVASGDSVIAMLHKDTGEMGTFEYPETEGADGPVLEGETPVMQEVMVE